MHLVIDQFKFGFMMNSAKIIKLILISILGVCGSVAVLDVRCHFGVVCTAAVNARFYSRAFNHSVK